MPMPKNQALRERLLALLKRDKELTVNQIATRFGVSEKCIWNVADDLKVRDQIKRRRSY